MSWLFSQVLVEGYLGDTSLDGEQSAPLSGNSTQQAYCAPDKMTKFFRLSRFGMTYKPLTEDRGEELLMLYLADFHAKTSAQRGGGRVLTGTEAECGVKWRGSFTKYSQDSCSWKTHQCSLLGDLEEFSETWPQWGLMRGGECWEQQTLEQTIKETEFGSLQKWPTPTRRDYKGANGFIRTQEKLANGERAHMGQLPNAVQQSMGKAIGGTLNPAFSEWLMGWPLGWTDLKPLEMGKSPSAQPQHGES